MIQIKRLLLSLFSMWIILGVNFAFADEEYLASWTIVRKTCLKKLIRTATGIQRGKTTCTDNDPVNEEVFNTATDWGEDEIGPYVAYFELVRTATGFVVRVTKCDDYFFGGCDPTVEAPLESVFPYALQKIAPQISLVRRIFIPGPNTSALRNDYAAYVLNQNEIPTAAKRIIFSNPSTKTALGASAAPDGGMSVELIADSTIWNLVTRRLKNGLPIGPIFSWIVPAYTGYSPDITNAIEENVNGSVRRIRYLVYRSFRNVGTASQQSQVLIQKIDDATGQPIGLPNALTNFAPALQATAEAIQADAIAPDGSLFLYAVYSAACKRQILRMIALVNGLKVGPVFTIVPCAGLANTPAGVLGIDIMLPDSSQTAKPK